MRFSALDYVRIGCSDREGTYQMATAEESGDKAIGRNEYANLRATACLQAVLRQEDFTLPLVWPRQLHETFARLARLVPLGTLCNLNGL